MTINVKPSANYINNNNLTSRRDPNYWRERREQWARYKARVGCDWAGINRTQIEVAAFLAGLRKRRAA